MLSPSWQLRYPLVLQLSDAGTHMGRPSPEGRIDSLRGEEIATLRFHGSHIQEADGEMTSNQPKVRKALDTVTVLHEA